MSNTILRGMLRKEAKRIYKEQTKNIPRRSRISFSEFFKKYLAMKKEKSNSVIEQEGEDFDFDNFVNVNEINDEDIETVKGSNAEE